MSTLIKFPQWATSGDVLEPSEGKKLVGYSASQERPARKTINWLFRQSYNWLVNLASTATRYDSVADFCTYADEGETGIVNVDYATFVPCSQIENVASVGIRSMTTDGQYWIVLQTSSLTTQPRTAINGTAIRSFTPVQAVTTMVKAVSNGHYVALIHDTWLEIFDRDSGVAVGQYNHGATLTDVAIDANRAYIVGAANAGNAGRAVNLANASLAWSYDHDATLQCVCTDGYQVYVGGAAAGAGAVSTVGSHVVALRASTGAVQWDTTDAAVAGPSRMVTDGADLYWVYSTTGLRRASAVTGEIMDGVVMANISAIEIDPEYIYVNAAGLSVLVSPRATSLGLLDITKPFFTVAAAITQINCDGDRIGLVASGTSFQTRNRPSAKPRRWYRSDVDNDTFLPYRRVAFPLE